MSAKRKDKSRSPGRSGAEVRARRVPDSDSWELLHPRCALDRAMDIEEVSDMVAAGEFDIAIEELRWLLSGCSDFIHAHRMLGELALEQNDVPLARGHFGHAYRAGAAAIRKAGNVQSVPYSREANQSFFECGKGLIYCLNKLDKKKMAREVVTQLLKFDPTDPLNVRALIEEK